MKLRPFEIGLIAFFAISAVIAIIMVSIFQAKPSSESQKYGDRVEIWGTLPQAPMTSFLTAVSADIEELGVVTYTYIDERTFDDVLLNAIAEGRSPDMVIIPQSLLVQYRAKLTPISPDVVTKRTFRDMYIDGAEIFYMSDGVYGIPFAVDPMVMYWNRDMFSSAGLSTPPRTWEQLVAVSTPALTRSNNLREIFQSAVAFGGYDNVTHAKDIIALLSLQTGSNMVSEQNGTYDVNLGGSAQGVSTLETVLNFYTQFSIPTSSLYTWNKGKPNDLDAFTTGQLALYFGLGSEWGILEKKNPNLNFDIAQVPQGEGVTTLRTFGNFYAFAIPRASQKASGAFAVAQLFASPQYAEQLARAYDFVPVLRAGVGAQNNSTDAVRYQSALYARGWLDPSPQQTNEIFREIVEGIVEGSERMKQSVSDAVLQLKGLF